jgi:hypothetical protein
VKNEKELHKFIEGAYECQRIFIHSQDIGQDAKTIGRIVRRIIESGT